MLKLHLIIHLFLLLHNFGSYVVLTYVLTTPAGAQLSQLCSPKRINCNSHYFNPKFIGHMSQLKLDVHLNPPGMAK